MGQVMCVGCMLIAGLASQAPSGQPLSGPVAAPETMAPATVQAPAVPGTPAPAVPSSGATAPGVPGAPLSSRVLEPVPPAKSRYLVQVMEGVLPERRPLCRRPDESQAAGGLARTAPVERRGARPRLPARWLRRVLRRRGARGAASDHGLDGEDDAAERSDARSGDRAAPPPDERTRRQAPHGRRNRASPRRTARPSRRCPRSQSLRHGRPHRRQRRAGFVGRRRCHERPERVQHERAAGSPCAVGASPARRIRPGCRIRTPPTSWKCARR